jgi:hypothetical protein
MKQMKWILSALLAIGFFVTALVGCKDDEPPELVLVSLEANGIDLNAATSPSNVPTGATIIGEFSTNIDQATTSAITLQRQYDNAVVPTTISVSGKTVTITPVDDFGTGTLFILSFGSGLTSDAGKVLTTPIERNFTTVGTFAVPGAIVHYTFEDNADNIIGNGYTPAANQIVGITYVEGRRPEAGKAASFNGTTSIIEISNGDQLMNNGNWTMSLWVKPNSQHDRGQFVMGLGAFFGFQFEIFGGYNGFKLAASYAHNHPDGAGKFGEDLWADGEGNTGWQGWVFSKDFTPVGGMNTVIKDKWAHYVFVYNASTKQGIIYLNGERIKEQDFDQWPDGDIKRFATGLSYRGEAPEVVNELALGFIQSRAGTLWADEPWGGYTFPGANHFHGLMDDVIIYHKVITPAEITLMYNSGKP